MRREHAEGLARALEDKRRKREWQAREAAERGEEFVPQYDPDLYGPLAV